MTHARPMFPPRAGRDDLSDLVLAAVPEAPPKASDGPVYVRTDISPAELFKAMGEARSEAAAAIEQLIAILDLIDGNCDLEPAGDELDQDADSEPSLASQEHFPDGDAWRRRPGVYRDATGSQARWGDQGNSDDREGDAGYDDREGDDLQHGGEGEREDDEYSGDEHEPSLGSFDRLTNQDHAWRQISGNARTWLDYTNTDREVDRAE